jgi:hypothetical protein
MAEKQTKRSFIKYITPRGVLVFPKLNKADEYKGKTTYNTKVKLDLSNPGVQEFVDQVREQHAAAFEAAKTELKEKAEAEKDAKKKRKIADSLAALEVGTNPIKPVTLEDGTDSETLVVFAVKMPHEKKDRQTGVMVPQRPKLLDASGKKEVDPKKYAVWGGSEAKVAGFFMPYYNPATNSAGVSLRMTHVQILKLVSGGNMDPGFAAEDGFAADDDVEGAGDGNPFSDDEEKPAGDAPSSGVKF